MQTRRDATTTRQSLLMVLAILMPCILIGCRSRTAKAPNERQAQDSRPASRIGTSDDASIKPPNRRSDRNQTYRVVGVADRPRNAALQRELTLVNARTDGWNSEEFSEHAAAQLKRLGDVLSSSRGDVAELGQLVAADFSLRTLPPQPRKEVFRDSQLVVRRLVATDDKRIEMHGTDSLLRLFSSLRPSLGDQEKARFAAKIISVDLTGPSPRTRVQVQFFSHGDHGRQQIDSAWSCRWHSKGPQPLLTNVEVHDIEIVESSAPDPLFADCTESVFQNAACYDQQIVHSLNYWRDRLDWRFGSEVIGAHGLAVADVNGDGLDDLYVCETGGLPNRLLVQNVDGTLRESHESGLDFLEPTQSVLFLDLDNDGDQDAIVAAAPYLLILENDGAANFTRRHAVNSNAITRSIASADFDRDGDLDFYVCGYSVRHSGPDSAVGLGRPLPFHDANNGVANYLLENRGEWKFVDVTAAVGLDVNNRRFSYAAAWEDYDLDGDPDIYVANDFGHNNLYRNDNGHFVDVAATAGVEDISAGMSVSWGDYNLDGYPDLYVGNMFSSAGNRITYQRRFRPRTGVADRSHFQRHARGNSLFENQGDGTFRDVSVAANVTRGRWAWSSNFVDINNDGWRDLVVANGMVTGEHDDGDL